LKENKLMPNMALAQRRADSANLNIFYPLFFSFGLTVLQLKFHFKLNSFHNLHQHRADSATNSLAAPMPVIGCNGIGTLQL